MFLFQPSASGGKVESVMDRQIDGSEMRSDAQIRNANKSLVRVKYFTPRRARYSFSLNEQEF